MTAKDDKLAIIWGPMETAVRSSLASATWITEADEFSKQLLLSQAQSLDNMEEDFVDGRITRAELEKSRYMTNSHLIQMLKQLGLTPESRRGVPEEKPEEKESESARRIRERRERRRRTVADRK
nr:MAG TPA: terminase small subunit [Caudoviricetes sp.]